MKVAGSLPKQCTGLHLPSCPRQRGTSGDYSTGAHAACRPHCSDLPLQNTRMISYEAADGAVTACTSALLPEVAGVPAAFGWKGAACGCSTSAAGTWVSACCSCSCGWTPPGPACFGRAHMTWAVDSLLMPARWCACTGKIACRSGSKLPWYPASQCFPHCELRPQQGPRHCSSMLTSHHGCARVRSCRACWPACCSPAPLWSCLAQCPA